MFNTSYVLEYYLEGSTVVVTHQLYRFIDWKYILMPIA